MSRCRMTCVLLAFAMLPAAAVAEDAPVLSPLQTALACAPPPRVTKAGRAAVPRIVGSQDTVPRTLFGTRDLLVIAAPAKTKLAPGERYFVRRGASLPATTFGAMESMAYDTSGGPGHAIETLGWVRIVAVRDTMALATVEHACANIESDDYLEPFEVPTVPAALTSQAPSRTLDFSSPSRVLFADEDRGSAGIGEFIVVDTGNRRGVKTGARLAIYRDMQIAQVPLTSIGEAVIVSDAPDLAVARIVAARDAVLSGDLLVPEKK